MSAMFTAATSAYRFRNDDGTQTTATWMAAQNVTPANVLVGVTFRIRFRMGDTGGASGTITPRLRYTPGTGGSYTELSTTTPVKLVSSANVANGTATTTQLTGGSGGTFVAGQVRHDNAHAAVSIGASGNTEAEWAVQFDAAQVSDGEVFTFQVYNDTASMSQVTATVTVAKLPDVPTGLTATPISSNQIDLSWNAVTGATGYDVERDSVIVSTNQAGTTFNDTGRASSTTYNYRVRAKNSAGDSAWTSVVQGTTPGSGQSFVANLLTAPAALHTPGVLGHPAPVILALLSSPATVRTPATLVATNVTVVVPHLFV